MQGVLFQWQTKSISPWALVFIRTGFTNITAYPLEENTIIDPEKRVKTRMEIARRLHERFGDVGLGDPDPKPVPLITFGMVMLPAIFGCEIIYKDEALPWAMPLNLSEKEIMALKVPDIFHSPPMTNMIEQIEYLQR